MSLIKSNTILAYKKDQILKHIKKEKIEVRYPQNFNVTLEFLRLTLLIYYNHAIPNKYSKLLLDCVVARTHCFVRNPNTSYHSIAFLANASVRDNILKSFCHGIVKYRHTKTPEYNVKVRAYVAHLGIVIVNPDNHSAFWIKVKTTENCWKDLLNFVINKKFQLNYTQLLKYHGDLVLADKKNNNNSNMLNVYSQLQQIFKSEKNNNNENNNNNNNNFQSNICNSSLIGVQSFDDNFAKSRFSSNQDSISENEGKNSNEEEDEIEFMEPGNNKNNIQQQQQKLIQQQNQQIIQQKNQQMIQQKNQQKLLYDKEKQIAVKELELQKMQHQQEQIVKEKDQFAHMLHQQSQQIYELQKYQENLKKQIPVNFKFEGLKNNNNNNNNSNVNKDEIRKMLNDFSNNWLKSYQEEQNKFIKSASDQLNDMKKRMTLQTQERDEFTTNIAESLSLVKQQQNDLKQQLEHNVNDLNRDDNKTTDEEVDKYFSLNDIRSDGKYGDLTKDKRFDCVSYKNTGNMPDPDRFFDFSSKADNEHFPLLDNKSNSKKVSGNKESSRRRSKKTSKKSERNPVTRGLQRLMEKNHERQRRKHNGDPDGSSSSSHYSSDSNKDFNYIVKTPEKKKNLKKYQKPSYEDDMYGFYRDNILFPKNQHRELSEEEFSDNKVKYNENGIRMNFIEVVPLRKRKSFRFDKLMQPHYIEHLKLNNDNKNLLKSVKKDPLLKKFKRHIRIEYENDDNDPIGSMVSAMRSHINRSKNLSFISTDYMVKYVEALKPRLYLINKIISPNSLELFDYMKYAINIRYLDIKKNISLYEESLQYYEYFIEQYKQSKAENIKNLLILLKNHMQTLKNSINIQLSLLDFDLKANYKIDQVVKALNICMKKDPAVVIKQSKEYMKNVDKPKDLISLVDTNKSKLLKIHKMSNLSGNSIVKDENTNSKHEDQLLPYDHGKDSSHFDSQLFSVQKKLGNIVDQYRFDNNNNNNFRQNNYRGRGRNRGGYRGRRWYSNYYHRDGYYKPRGYRGKGRGRGRGRGRRDYKPKDESESKETRFPTKEEKPDRS